MLIIHHPVFVLRKIEKKVQHITATQAVTQTLKFKICLTSLKSAFLSELRPKVDTNRM